MGFDLVTDMLLAAAAGAAARSRAKAGRRPPGSRARRYREIFLMLVAYIAAARRMDPQAALRGLLGAG